jgi:zinc transporter
MTKKERAFSVAMLLDGKGGARELSDDEVASWTPADGLLWVDLNLNNRGGRRWLTDTDQVDENARSILLAEETRPRSLALDDSLVVIMRGINMNPGAVPDDMVAVRIWLGQDRIITSRRRKVLSIGDVRDELLARRGPKTAGQFVVALSARLTARIEAAVENIERLLEELGERLTGGDIATVRTELGTVRRQAAVIRRHLSPQRDALDRIARNPAGILSAGDVFDLREEGDHLMRHIEDLDLARENALVTQEELMNRIAQEQNSRMYLLSVIAAIFLPLTFVTGLLGMNVAGLPGTVNPNGFFFSAVIMVLLGVALIGYFRWRKWI